MNEIKRLSKKFSHEPMFQLLLDIALTYINLPLAQANQTIHQTLENMGQFVSADRVYIFTYNFSNNTCSNTYEWCAPGIEPEISHLQDVPIDFIPQWIEAHRAGQALYFADVPELPDDDPIKAILHPQGIKSILTLPMTDGTRLLGFVGFDSVSTYHQYTEAEQTLLAVFAQMLVNIELRLETMNLLTRERDKAAKAAQVKGEFVANISHELRTPLNAIIGFTDLLSYSQLNTSQRQYLAHIQSSSVVLLDLINDVLNFSKFEAGKLDIKPRPNSLFELCRELEALLTPALQNKPVALEVKVDESIPASLQFDAIRLGQVLSNLLTNAIKFTDHGKVTLRLVHQGQHDNQHTIRFSVADTGIGISAEDIDKIGQAFIQLDGSMTRKRGGTGLGLVISKQLIQQMDGALEITSTLGEGSQFSFQLVLQQAASISTEGIKKVQPEQQFQGTAVLVAEDNPMNQMVIEKMLQRLGVQACVVEDGKAAIKQVQQHRYDLVLMDLQMPVMDGFTATKRIKEKHPNLPVIALSAALLDQDRQMAIEAGVDGHLCKPLTLNTLETELSRWLS